jgi:hypothetical protein
MVFVSKQENGNYIFVFALRNAVLNNVNLVYSSSALFCFGIGFAVCPAWYRPDTERTEPFLELVCA